MRSVKVMDCESLDDAISTAAAKLGYPVVKDEQREAVKEFMKGRDVFVSLPTGYGKSFCYAVLPWAFDSLCPSTSKQSIVICVSPLVSLMQDQKDKFAPRGLVTEFVGEGLASSGALERIDKGMCQLVYITPESLLCNLHWRELLRTKIYQENLVALVVDEAHCVKKW